MKVLAYGHRRISGRRFSPEVTTGMSVSAGYRRSGKEKRVVVL